MDKSVIQNESSKFWYENIFRENLEQPHFQIFGCIRYKECNLLLLNMPHTLATFTRQSTN